MQELTAQDLAVLETLKEDGIAIAKMNHWRRGKSALELYCEQRGIKLKIDRTNKIFGNPFKLANTKDDKARAEVISKFKAYAVNEPSIIANLPKLKGKILFCHCWPKPCHGDVLKELALNNRLY